MSESPEGLGIWHSEGSTLPLYVVTLPGFFDEVLPSFTNVFVCWAYLGTQNNLVINRLLAVFFWVSHDELVQYHSDSIWFSLGPEGCIFHGCPRSVL